MTHEDVEAIQELAPITLFIVVALCVVIGISLRDCEAHTERMSAIEHGCLTLDGGAE